MKSDKEQKGELLEFSVIYTDRAINMLSSPFQKVMQDISHELRTVYNADKIALVPGSGTFVLDSIAAGCVFVDMKELDVDVIVSAPQKGWSGHSCCGIVLMNDRVYAEEIVKSHESNSFSLDLKKWFQVMEKYESGGAMYHTTLPTDSLTQFRDVVKESLNVLGKEKLEKKTFELGNKIRKVLEENGLESIVAQDECKAPTVVVSKYNGTNIVKKFAQVGVQVVGGVPLKIDEPEDLHSKLFRVGLFGLDKLMDVDNTVKVFEQKLKMALAIEL